MPIPKDLIYDSLLVHRGVYSNDLKEFYFVTSNKSYQKFNINLVKLENGKWNSPSKAWFNSQYDDHGLSFSPDGKSLFFSSTRPVPEKSIANTWHLWRSNFSNGKWSQPEFIDIPNLRDKLVSHPTVTPNGTLYFHASKIDYSDMDIYKSEIENGIYQNASKVTFEGIENGTCTPYISSDGNILLFATIDQTLPIYYVSKTENGWSVPVRLSDEINSGSQANPYLTPDNKRLLLAREVQKNNHWIIDEVETSSFLNKN